MAKRIFDFSVIFPVAVKLSKRELPVGGTVSAGYPAEAYNYIEEPINLNKYILGEPRAASRSRKSGTDPISNVWVTHAGMTGERIFIGDLLVINAAIPATPDMLRLIRYDDEFTVRRIIEHEDHIELISPNAEVSPIIVSEGEEVISLGVVWRVIKKFSVYRDNYAGFPPDAEGIIEKGIDYMEYLVDWWETTVFLWSGGDSMIGDGIEKGDLLVVDRLAEVHPDSILVFVIDKQFTLKRVQHHSSYIELISSNPAIPPIRVNKGVEINRWGVLTGVVKKIVRS